MLMEADLPNDVEALRALVLEQARELDVLNIFQAEVERLKAIIEALQRHRFGRRSEQLDPDQFELALEEVETALAQAQHAVDKASRASGDRPHKANRGSLPAHLERIEQVIDVENKACPCCGGALHQIGEAVAERLDVVPTTFRVLVTRRARYGRRSCEGAILQAPAPARIVEGGIPTEALAQLGYQLLEPIILLQNLLQLTDLIGFQTGILPLPPMVGLFGYPNAADQICHRHPHLGLLQNRHNLLNRKSLPLHRRTSLQKGNAPEKLTYRVDHFFTITSPIQALQNADRLNRATGPIIASSRPPIRGATCQTR